jgi:nanoRNase/pAp phosphatase (c-di-AMP/oligoRNAs hydrolase)
MAELSSRSFPSFGRRSSEDRPLRADAATSARLPKPEDEAAHRVKQLVRAARGRERALVLTHDNPDPDSMASAVGVATILETLAGVNTRVAYGGIVGRAENRALVRVLKLPLVPVSRIVFDEYDFVALVDTQPEFGNHSLLSRVPADAVIDHHPARPSSYDVPFADVGGDFGATASIVTGYVRAAGIYPTPTLATALFYGIKSDTRDLGRELGPTDISNYQWLFPHVDHYALSQIEHPSVSAAYFAAFHRALEKARRHGDSIVSDLGPIYAPDMVAEIADRFLSLEGMRWSLAMGEYERQLYVSVRTSDRRMNAGRLIRDLLGPLGGSAGGHGSMAGGRIPLPDDRPRRAAALRKRLLRAFLSEFGAPASGEPLV